MARAHSGLPCPKPRVINKSDLLAMLHSIDANRALTDRVLLLETEFRRRIATHVMSLPAEDARFERFNTSPFVLMIHCMQRGYSRISQIERDILPAKQFSSMETSAGRMVEAVTLPIFGWQTVLSEMHSEDSALDGKRRERGIIKLATLKSGPRCLNDEMSENFADAIVGNAAAWARRARVRRIDFSYGVLYGTPRQSNKKDWHILRRICEKLPSRCVTAAPANTWKCAFVHDDVGVDVTIRVGTDWWDYLGGATCLVELCVALIRACVQPGHADPASFDYAISDLAEIVSLQSVPSTFNVSILQRSQLPWLFFLARHFCDVMGA